MGRSRLRRNVAVGIYKSIAADIQLNIREQVLTNSGGVWYYSSKEASPQLQKHLFFK